MRLLVVNERKPDWCMELADFYAHDLFTAKVILTQSHLIEEMTLHKGVSEEEELIEWLGQHPEFRPKIINLEGFDPLVEVRHRITLGKVRG